ncbi:PTS IIB subunit [Agromyces tardus]|jgi:PTS system cellobiose-specific IIB component|uniref:PTS IIB subunit n=1 Tax=Agromyces tardus TaxID=2583849 RepID=A0A3M8A9G0_9MICO|nr:PTS IIB subunit [Agromyces tardus]RNB47227.1 PTS IIB subunit [Agromyces tardus]
MRIIVVCGAGASSTFVALRVRRAADARGLRVDARAAAEAGLAEALDGADVLLVGAHLGDRVDALRELAAAASVPVAVLPAGATAADGDDALDLALDTVGGRS